MLREITDCEVCGNKNLVQTLTLGFHPLCDDLVEIGSSRICKEYPINILFCNDCITAHQGFQVPKHELFPQSYHYRAKQTLDVLNGLRSLVNSCEQYGLSGKKVLDIGCNDGSLLSFFAEKKARTFGIEPTGAYVEALHAGHNVLHAFFGEKTAEELAQKHGLFDIITFTNVFAHIEDLHDVVRGLKKIMHENTVIVIENHYLGAILEKFQFDTFYHEHPRTYSLTSFMHIARLLDCTMSHVEFPSRYNGNIRIFLEPKARHNASVTWEKLMDQERNFCQKMIDMGNKIPSWIDQTKENLNMNINKYGRLSAKAYPGRSMIPIKLLNLNEHHIDVIYEKPVSAKIGYYVPGTRIPIVSDAQFDAPGYKKPLLNLAWHIGDEIKQYMSGLGYSGSMIDLISTPTG